MILKNHISLTSANEVTQIVKPLFTHLGFSNFVYLRNFDDGSEIRLSNNSDWVAHCYDSEYYKNSIFEAAPHHYETGFVLWSQLTGHDLVLSAAREFNIDHGVTLLRKQDDGCEFYFLGTKPNNSHIVPKYLNNMDLLEHFVHYFNDKAAPLLKQSMHNKIIIPNKYQNVKPISSLPYEMAASEKEAFLQATMIATPLSKREIECANLLIRGLTAKEIGKKLHLSARTIESHITNMKQKLHCSTRSQLIQQLWHLEKLLA